MPREYTSTVVRYPTDRSSYAELVPIARSYLPQSESYVLIAESFSAPIAIQIAASHPRNLRGVVLCAGFAASPLSGIMRRIVLFFAPLLLNLKLGDFAASLFLVGPSASKELIAAVRRTVGSLPSSVLAERLKDVLACDVRQQLPAIDVQILCLKATQDRLVGSSCLDEVIRSTSQSMLKEIEGPHLILQREPTQCAEAIADFIKQL